MKRKLRIYAAGGLFNDAELMLNIHNVEILRKEGFLVFLPQEHGLVASPEFINLKEGETQESVRATGIGTIGFPTPAFRQQIFDDDNVAIQECDVVVSQLEGEGVDEGTAAECGYAFALGKPNFALRSDRRIYCDPILKVNNYLAGTLTNHITYDKVEDIIPFLKKIEASLNEEEGSKLYRVPAFKIDSVGEDGVQPTKSLDQLRTSSKVGDVSAI